MITEEKAKADQQLTKEQLPKMLERIRMHIASEDYNSAVEEITILNANIVSVMVLGHLLETD